MTTPGPDGVITAADLLFGSSEGAQEAMTRHVMSAGRTRARAFEPLARVPRGAAVRLAAIHAGRGDIGLALTIHELEVLTKRSHLELPGVKSLQRGFRLLPASAYPEEPHGHPGGQHPADYLGGQHSADYLGGQHS